MTALWQPSMYHRNMVNLGVNERDREKDSASVTPFHSPVSSKIA